jgi:hypothetical protein
MPTRIWIALLIGCGSHGPNTATVDASADVQGADVSTDGHTQTTQVALVATDDQGRPIAGAPVVFQAFDNAVIADVVTDVQGRAEAAMPGGGNVSLLIDQVGTAGDLHKGTFVWLGVKPGDVLEFGNPPPVATTPVDVINLALPAGNGGYSVRASCGNQQVSSATTTVTIHGCVSPSRFFVVNAAGLVYYTGELTFTDGQTLDLSSSQFRSKRTLSTQLANVSPQYTHSEGATRIADHGFLVDNVPTTVSLSNGTGVASSQVYDIPGLKLQHEAWLEGTAPGVVTFARRGVLSDLVVFDASDANQPPQTDSYAFADGMVTWQDHGSGSADMAYATVDLAQPGATQLRLQVSVFGPKQGSKLQLPTLPAAHGDFGPIANDTARVSFAGVSRATGGWDAMRRFAHRTLFLQDLDWLDGDFVDQGHLVFSGQ